MRWTDFVPAPETIGGLTFEPLYRDIVVFAVHGSHPLAGRRSIKATDFASCPVLSPTSVAIIGPFAKRLFIGQGLPEPAQSIETVSDSFAMVANRLHGSQILIY
jgi:LysR family transcriptional regulator, pca operon transcriptional activator